MEYEDFFSQLIATKTYFFLYKFVEEYNIFSIKDFP